VRNSLALVAESSVIVFGSPIRVIGCALDVANAGFTERVKDELFGRKFVPGWVTTRGAYELNVCGLELVWAGTTRGTIDMFTIGLAAGAPRLVTAREEEFCTVGLNPWPEALWMLPESAATKQIAENRICFINYSVY
jgi:hypothetical protein